jgi:hypothetical protein
MPRDELRNYLITIGLGERNAYGKFRVYAAGVDPKVLQAVLPGLFSTNRIAMLIFARVLCQVF